MKDEDGGGARRDLENIRLSFLFIFIISIDQGREEKEERYLFCYFLYISTYVPGLGFDVPKMSREKEDPVPQTNTGSLAVCLKIFKIFLEKESK